jgi:hypothetical protein
MQSLHLAPLKLKTISFPVILTDKGREGEGRENGEWKRRQLLDQMALLITHKYYLVLGNGVEKTALVDL